mgnify:CR=1 FL=1
MGLSGEVLDALTDLGFEKPSEIQIQAIPQLLLTDQDFIGLAQTGTGKTAAFGIPLIERIDPSNKKVQALILAPTRELGKQIAEQLALYSKNLPKINTLPVYGGAAISNQMKDLKKNVQVIIATPGRLIDLIGRKAVNLNDLEFLVLDEADEMLNMGFKDELDEILRHTPQSKRTWLFSATMPNEIKHIVARYMENPYEVRVKANIVNNDIEHQYAAVNGRDKAEALTRFMDMEPDMRGVVFCRTKRDTQNLAEELLKKNYKADALHGDLSQAQRDRVMKRFKNKELQLLIATDVAARGIDVDNLTHVFHHSLPDDLSYYTHRSGRTARAGKKGISVAFISGREKGYLNKIAGSLGIQFKKVTIPQIEDVAFTRINYSFNQLKDQRPEKNVSAKLKAQAGDILEDFSKDELVEKLLAVELKKLDKDSVKDLNADEKADYGKSSGSRGRGGYGGNRGGGGRRSGDGGGKFNRRGKGGGGESGGNFKKKDTGKKKRRRTHYNS